MNTRTVLALFFVLILVNVNKSEAQISNTPIANSTLAAKNDGKFDTFEYFITDIHTLSDATTMENNVKAKERIIDAKIDFSLHKITIYAEQGILESDIISIILFEGKKIIPNEKEISKHY